MLDFEALAAQATSVIVTWAPQILGALAVLLFGWMLANWAKRFTRKALSRAKVGKWPCSIQGASSRQSAPSRPMTTTFS